MRRPWKCVHHAPAAVLGGAERHTCYDLALQAVLVLEVVAGIDEAVVDKRWDPHQAVILR